MSGRLSKKPSDTSIAPHSENHSDADMSPVNGKVSGSERVKLSWSPGGILIRLIRFYQKGISPLKKPCCKYIPTCSNYALEAIRRFGALKGGALALWRILRCNPFSSGGYDPVPEKKKKGPGGESQDGPELF